MGEMALSRTFHGLLPAARTVHRTSRGWMSGPHTDCQWRVRADGAPPDAWRACPGRKLPCRGPPSAARPLTSSEEMRLPKVDLWAVVIASVHRGVGLDTCQLATVYVGRVGGHIRCGWGDLHTRLRLDCTRARLYTPRVNVAQPVGMRPVPAVICGPGC